MSVVPVLDPLAASEALAAVAAGHGTPVYVYDLDVVAARVAALRAALPPGVALAFAVKANPSLAVLAGLAGLGLGADVASAGEAEAVRRAGFPVDRVVMTGPGKGPAEHAAALAGAVGTLTVESLGELGRLESAAARAGVRVPVLLRATAGEAASGERTRIIGDAGAGKFGMDRDDLRRAAALAVRSAHLELRGLHRFGASNVTAAELLVAGARTAVALAREVLGETAAAIEGGPLVDLGGGLGIPYADGESELDLEALGRGLADVQAEARAAGLPGLRLLLEPGRYLVGPAGCYLARVVDRKRVAEVEVAVLDGGIHHVLRPALVGQAHRAVVLGRGPVGGSAGATGRVTLAGPLCTGLDLLGSGPSAVIPELGDLVAIRDVGAYGFTEAMPWFLSHPMPPEVVLRGGVAHLARPRLEPSAWLDLQRIPPSS